MSTNSIKIKDLEKFDPADHLQNEESIQGFLADAREEADPRWLPIALSHVERARKRWNLPSPTEAVAINVELPDFDVANYLEDEEEVEVYLAEAAKLNDAELWAKALDDVARARKRWGRPAHGDKSTPAS